MDMLRKLQLTELDMLKQLDRVCRTYEIPYFVIWGTALGAKRHQGFIPWDTISTLECFVRIISV